MDKSVLIVGLLAVGIVRADGEIAPAAPTSGGFSLPAQAIVAEKLVLDVVAKREVWQVMVKELYENLEAARRKLKDSAETLRRTFLKTIDDPLLSWKGNEVGSKRQKFAELLTEYNAGLADLSKELIQSVSAKVSSCGEGPVKEVLDKITTELKKDQETLVARLDGCKQKALEAWNKDLNDFVWSAGGMLSDVSMVEGLNIADRTRMIESFIEIIKKTYGMHNERLEQIISSLFDMHKRASSIIGLVGGTK